MKLVKKFVLPLFCSVILLFLIWQGVFWVGEYLKYREYNKVVGKTGYDITFNDWVLNFSLLKMYLVGDVVQFRSYQKYVDVQRSFNKPVVLWEDWKRDKKEIDQTIQDTIDNIEQELVDGRADIYGGDTPEETWEMFLDALRDGDVELASKYFIPRKQVEHLGWFQQVKDAGMLEKMVDDLSVSGLDIVFDSETMKDYAIKDDNGTRNAYVRARENLNNKWKLESL